MTAANFWAVASALLLGFLGSCAIVISGSSGGIPELAYAGVPMLASAVALFWLVVRRYPSNRAPESSQPDAVEEFERDIGANVGRFQLQQVTGTGDRGVVEAAVPR